MIKIYLIDGVVDRRAESSMNAENAIVYNGGKGEVIKDIGAVSPYVERAIFSETFVVKSINLGDLSAFMVSPDQSDEIGISDFIGKK